MHLLDFLLLAIHPLLLCSTTNITFSAFFFSLASLILLQLLKAPQISKKEQDISFLQVPPKD